MDRKTYYGNRGRQDGRRYHLVLRRKRFRFIMICAAVFAAAVIIGIFISSVKTDPAEQAEASADAVPAATPKPAPQIPPASEQNNLLKIAEDAAGREGKACYLTFDDGPTNTVTPAILDVLKQYHVKATFFMLGSMIEKNRDIAKRVYDEGHLLANHTYSHDYKALYATEESFMGEVEKTEGLICEVTGEEPFKLIRFPGGSYNAGDHAAEKQKYKLLLQEKGYYYVDWNALNGDAEGSSRTPEQLLARMKETAGKDHIVVLMHDAAAKKSTPEALPAIIEYLKSAGYEFYRLDEIKYYETGEEEKPASMIM